MSEPRIQLPPAVENIVAALEGGGFSTYLVGGSVRDALAGAPCRDFDLASQASPEDVMKLFRRAVPIGLRHGTVMVPSPAGPVDITQLRGGPEIEADLGLRDFTVNAIAWHPREARLLDPFGGADDLSERRLRCVGSASKRLEDDPLRAVRAARFVATLDLDPDSALVHAMAEVRAALGTVSRERIRNELRILIQGPRASLGLDLLRQTGLEAEFAPGVRKEAGPLVDAMPPELDTRLAAWLLGTNVTSILARLRFPRRRVEHVAKLVSLHPIDQHANPTGDASLRRLLKRCGGADFETLIKLRETEASLTGLDPETQAGVARSLSALREGMERVRASGTLALRRADLALSGREVMALLDATPGPEVGRALRYLTEQVLEDPSCNTPEKLRELLRAWEA